MAITPTSISKRYKLLNAGNLDWWWGPWASVSQANAALPSSLDTDGANVRQGKFVAIGNSVSGYVVYWWNNNYTDGGLVPYITSSYEDLIVTVDTYEQMLAAATGNKVLKIFVTEGNQYNEPGEFYDYIPTKGVAYLGIDFNYTE